MDIVKVTAMAAAEDTVEYPMWFWYRASDRHNHGPLLYCNLSILKHLLATNLSYDHVEAARIADYLAESMAVMKMKDIVIIDRAGENLTAELLKVIRLCVHPNELSQCPKIYGMFLSFHIGEGNNAVVELILQSANSLHEKYELLKAQTNYDSPVETACCAGNVTALKTIVKHLSQSVVTNYFRIVCLYMMTQTMKKV